jgi:hypothetical protein
VQTILIFLINLPAKEPLKLRAGPLSQEFLVKLKTIEKHQPIEYYRTNRILKKNKK